MDRRHFLAAGSAAVLATIAGIPRTLGQYAAPATEGPLVWEAEAVTFETISSLFEAFGGIQKLLPREIGQAIVVLKPNFCIPRPDSAGTTTSSELLDLLCRRLIADGAKRIIITDHTLQKTSDFDNASFLDLARQHPEVKVALANEERMFEPVEVPGKVLKNTDRMRLLSKADLFINVATAKHHSATQVSLGAKNLMGTIWNRKDFHTKMDLAQAIGDLALVVRPTLTIIDASRVLLSGGPIGPGRVIAENRFFASLDMVAADAVVTSRYSFGGREIAPNDVAHLRAAYENGVGEIDLQKIRVTKV